MNGGADESVALGGAPEVGDSLLRDL